MFLVVSFLYHEILTLILILILIVILFVIIIIRWSRILLLSIRLVIFISVLLLLVCPEINTHIGVLYLFLDLTPCTLGISIFSHCSTHSTCSFLLHIWVGCSDTWLGRVAIVATIVLLKLVWRPFLQRLVCCSLSLLAKLKITLGIVPWEPSTRV